MIRGKGGIGYSVLVTRQRICERRYALWVRRAIKRLEINWLTPTLVLEPGDWDRILSYTPKLMLEVAMDRLTHIGPKESYDKWAILRGSNRIIYVNGFHFTLHSSEKNHKLEQLVWRCKRSRGNYNVQSRLMMLWGKYLVARTREACLGMNYFFFVSNINNRTKYSHKRAAQFTPYTITYQPLLSTRSRQPTLK